MVDHQDSTPTPEIQRPTRRAFLGHAAGAYTLVSGLAMAPVIASDPFTARFLGYRAALDAFNKADDPDEIEDPGTSFGADLRDGRYAIKTPDGAARALRYILDEDVVADTLCVAILTTALAFLERPSA